MSLSQEKKSFLIITGSFSPDVAVTKPQRRPVGGSRNNLWNVWAPLTMLIFILKIQFKFVTNVLDDRKPIVTVCRKCSDPLWSPRGRDWSVFCSTYFPFFFHCMCSFLHWCLHLMFFSDCKDLSLCFVFPVNSETCVQFCLMWTLLLVFSHFCDYLMCFTCVFKRRGIETFGTKRWLLNNGWMDGWIRKKNVRNISQQRHLVVRYEWFSNITLNKQEWSVPGSPGLIITSPRSSLIPDAMSPLDGCC